MSNQEIKEMHRTSHGKMVDFMLQQVTGKNKSSLNKADSKGLR